MFVTFLVSNYSACIYKKFFHFLSDVVLLLDQNLKMNGEVPSVPITTLAGITSLTERKDIYNIKKTMQSRYKKQVSMNRECHNYKQQTHSTARNGHRTQALTQQQEYN